MKYISDSYEQLIRKSYGYDMDAQKVPEWNLVRELYENNYVNRNDDTQRIPKIIHQIWLGGAVPEKYRHFMESWKYYHPDWEYKLWTDSNINEIHIEKREIFDRAVNLGMKSDILRYEILRQIGGLYVDTDFECLRAFDDLLYLNFFTGISYDTKLVLYVGLIASIPNHPIITACINALFPFYSGHMASMIMKITGPYHFTKCFLASVSKNDKGVAAFPMGFFYPCPNNVKIDFDNIKQAYEFLLPCSYAVHHWAVSWAKSNK